VLTERWFREAIRALEHIRDEVDSEIARLTRERDAERLRADEAEPQVETHGMLRGVYGEGA
jgi:hypothetical protein